MWHLTSLDMKSIISRSIRRSLLYLSLIPASLNYQNLFSKTFLITSFTELLSQHILINVENVMNQTISVKIAQSLRSINQLRLRKLNSSLMISFSIKILRHNIPAAVMMIISQKIIWIFQKTLIFYKKYYKV